MTRISARRDGRTQHTRYAACACAAATLPCRYQAGERNEKPSIVGGGVLVSAGGCKVLSICLNCDSHNRWGLPSGGLRHRREGSGHGVAGWLQVTRGRTSAGEPHLCTLCTRSGRRRGQVCRGSTIGCESARARRLAADLARVHQTGDEPARGRGARGGAGSCGACGSMAQGPGRPAPPRSAGHAPIFPDSQKHSGAWGACNASFKVRCAWRPSDHCPAAAAGGRLHHHTRPRAPDLRVAGLKW